VLNALHGTPFCLEEEEEEAGVIKKIIEKHK